MARKTQAGRNEQQAAMHTVNDDKNDRRQMVPQIGIDLGGTKIEGVVLADAGSATPAAAARIGEAASNAELARRRIETPRQDYDATIRALADLIRWLTDQVAMTLSAPSESAPFDADGSLPTIGIAMPGSIGPKTGLVQNANSTWLNGKPFQRDLEDAIGRAVRCANDANCFALSEATDGAGAGARTVFGVILGTGCGGGIVHEGRLLDGPRAIGGEWGHNPLPWPQMTTDSDEAGELPGPLCWCGKNGCMESWVSGPGLAADHERHWGERLEAAAIAARADGSARAEEEQRQQARSTLERHASRLARGLAGVVNLIDPEVIVLGGGLSKLTHLYDELPALMAPYIFAEDRRVTIKPPRWGDASGVRGAAWLWNDIAHV